MLLQSVSNETATSEITQISNSIVKRQDNEENSTVIDRKLVSTRIVSVFEFKKILIEHCELEYPISISLQKQLTLGKRYCSKRLRKFIAASFFGKAKLSNVVWSRLRKIAIAKKTNTTYPKADKSKVLEADEIEWIFLVSLYIRNRNLKYVPNISQSVLDNFNAWIQLVLPKITKVEVFYQIENDELIKEVSYICDWFHPDSDKSSQIDYLTLNDLLKKTFYGYSPTPQYIGKLGFAKPTTRTYSFNDFVLIRNRFIQSRANQSRPTSFILFEQL
jgi:hypothetical protein